MERNSKLGVIEVTIATLALVISVGGLAVTLGNRITTLEENAKYTEERLEYMYEMHEAARTDLKDQLSVIGTTLNQINVVVGRVEERTRGLDGRLSRVEEAVGG